MIAQRKGHTTKPPEADEPSLASTIRRFASPTRKAFGVWRSFETDLDVLHAVIAEIEETVLPRRIDVKGRETGASASLVIANRRLVKIEEFEIGETGEIAEACVAVLMRVFAGCRTLKFDSIDCSPKSSGTARSCSAAALLQAAGNAVEKEASGSSFEDLVEKIRSKSEAWFGTDAPCSQRSCEDSLEISQLWSRYMAYRSKLQSDRIQLHAGRPTLSILPATNTHIHVLLESQTSQTIALFRESQRDQVLAVWRRYVRGGKG